MQIATYVWKAIVDKIQTFVYNIDIGTGISICVQSVSAAILHAEL